MVEGTGSSRPSAIPLMVLRRIFPERVLGSAGTTSTALKLATAPMECLTAATSSAPKPSPDTPDLSTTRARGTWPLTSSDTPRTAHSATAGCEAITASITPVDSRWPATLMTSSMRPITNR